MAGEKESYTLELNPDHMEFLTSIKEKYTIADESKVVRIALDYLFLNEDATGHLLYPLPVPPLRRLATTQPPFACGEWPRNG